MRYKEAGYADFWVTCSIEDDFAQLDIELGLNSDRSDNLGTEQGTTGKES